MEELLLNLLNRLEAIGERDESLFDTYVREEMGEAVFQGFIKPTPGYVLPDDYGMSVENNHAIRAVLAEYIEAAKLLARNWASPRSTRGSRRLRAVPCGPL